MSRYQRPGRQPDRIKRKDACKAMAGACMIVALLVIVCIVLGHWEEAFFHVNAPEDQPAGIQEPEQKTITIDGKTYHQRENLETYLFLGIDVEGPVKAVEGYYGGGQADVQIVVVIDHDRKTWQMLQLNRDTMVEVPILGIQGDVVGKEYQQLALSHSYGDGLKESCENSVKTVSNLLWGQEIDGYFSMNMDGVVIINDAVGGVPVEITSDFSEIDQTLTLGETITLDGNQALTFVRSRQDVDDQTNIARMARQRRYLSALLEKVGTLNDERIITTYDALQDYVVTDMGSKTILNLSEDVGAYEFLGVLTIDGEARVEEEHWAFYLDKQSLQEAMLELFYH